MLIGELAERTGTSERLLRYYERMGLLRPERRPNGYRAYDESAEQTVVRIRALLAAGLPTRVIREVIPCTSSDAAVLPCPGVLDAMRERLRLLDQRSAEIATARQVLQRTIAATERAAAAEGEAVRRDH
ncbi:MerR family transcriptional regulator [Streptosporangium sp. NBC_01756]|uniref:MerR family transcriptional regulator n=1 Tax=Streptosporangium sp. NBC_01756 TaxID=2975950 RepID=UPI002DD96C66|nr:MerR family transcriptional regulator [Streptosporangium sp. NBC_01756]WSC87351.1 MerR family transcriptional regulator [Streptosporangium sp. NBC_01756]